MPYLCRDVSQIVDEFLADDQPYAVFVDNNLGSRPKYLRQLCRALRPLEKIWSAAVTIDVTDDPGLIREMSLSGCTGVFVDLDGPRPMAWVITDGGGNAAAEVQIPPGATGREIVFQAVVRASCKVSNVVTALFD